MERREFIKKTIRGAGAAILGSAALTEGSFSANIPPQSPNILHIMSDQQQWGTIANRTQCQTPNINRLAEEGILFNRSYTPNALCCPARAMILTGSYHWHNGVFNQVHSSPSVHRDMYANVVTYSMRIKKAGYRTGYVGKWHASYKRTPLNFGYDEIGAPMGYNMKLLKGVTYSDERKKISGKIIPIRTFQWRGSEPFTMWGYDSGSEDETGMWRVAETAIKMMNRFSGEKNPWLLEVHFVEPHDAYTPLKKYLDRYDPSSIQVPKSFYDTFENKPGMHKRESESWGKITEKDYQESRAFYYAYTEQLDTQIGRILDALEKTGQADNTIVVYTTDHGDMVGAHRMWIKGWIPYEECYRIPLVIRWRQKIKPGLVSNRLVQTHDLAHTYVDILGLEPLQFPDGKSIAPLFEKSDRTDWRDDILCAFYGGEFLYTQRIVITERYKYVFNGFDYDECYDLAKDPEEMHNCINDPEYKPVVDDMRARLYDLMNKFEDPYGDKQNRISIGQPPNRYGAPRYLPRGKRL